MEIKYIENQQSLELFCQQLAQAEFLALDTEFVRTRTLLPKLGLIQFCDGKVIGLIDPTALDDLSPVWALISDKSILKVIHACSEDLEVFLTAGQCRPENLLDSQIVMSFLGHGLSMGYAAMVKHFLDIDLDKSESRTDWLKRPLSAKQLDYAAADVMHLHHIAPKLIAQAEQANWLEAAKAETETQIIKKFTPVTPERLYLDMKMAWKLQPQQLVRLKELCKWRYEQAVKRDMPLGFIAKDHTLLMMSQRDPKSVGAMASYQGVEILDVRHQGKAMLSVLKRANDIAPEMYPDKVARLDDYPGYKQIFKKVKEFIHSQAEQQNIPLEICGSKKQINQFLSYVWHLNGVEQQADKVELLIGWRGQYFGDKLLTFARNGF